MTVWIRPHTHPHTHTHTHTGFNNLSRLDGARVAACPSIAVLDVSNNRLSEFPADVAKCSKLHTLDVSNNDLGGECQACQLPVVCVSRALLCPAPRLGWQTSRFSWATWNP